MVPCIGRIKTHESTRKLARRLKAGTARILDATISQAETAGMSRSPSRSTALSRSAASAAQRHGGTVGVDVGIRHLAVLSTGETISDPRPLDHAQRRFRRLNRQLARSHGPRAPDGALRVPSGGWRQTRKRLAQAHARVARIRRDGLNKLTTRLATSYDTIVVEQLNVAGMVRNRHLSRAISDAGFAELRRQLSYKSAWYGSVLVTADPWYPSSKTCSACGTVKAKLLLRSGCSAARTVGSASNVTSTRPSTLLPSSPSWSPGVARRPKTPVEEL